MQSQTKTVIRRYDDGTSETYEYRAYPVSRGRVRIGQYYEEALPLHALVERGHAWVRFTSACDFVLLDDGYHQAVLGGPLPASFGSPIAS